MSRQDDVRFRRRRRHTLHVKEVNIIDGIVLNFLERFQFQRFSTLFVAHDDSQAGLPRDRTLLSLYIYKAKLCVLLFSFFPRLFHMDSIANKRKRKANTYIWLSRRDERR